MADEITTWVVTPAQLHAELSRHGLVVGGGSPVRGLSRTDGDLECVEGSSDPAFADALRAIAEPALQVRSIVASPSITHTASFYGLSSELMVLCFVAEDGVHISSPWTVEAVAGAAAGQYLDAPLPIASEAQRLGPAGMTALASAVDVVREMILESLEAREPDRPFASDYEALAQQAERGLSSSDNRWVVSLFNALLPMKAHPRLESLADGMAELEAAGFVACGDASWSPQPSLLRMAVDWLIPIPASAHELISVEDGVVAEYRHRVTVRGSGPLWVLDFDDVTADAPVAEVRSISAAEYLVSLTVAITSQVGPGGASFCICCGDRTLPVAEFCVSCGSSLGS